MKIGIIIKNYAVGEVFDKSGMPNKCGAEFHAENHGKLFAEKGNSVYIMTKKSHLLTRGRETLNGIDVVRLHAPFRWLESTGEWRTGQDLPGQLHVYGPALKEGA